MAETSLVKIISEKLVKPSSPTPPSSRYYKVNAIDACFGDWLVNVGLFYPKGCFHGRSLSRREELFEQLETSLSKTLSYYYPFAGRFMDDNITMDCNDAGVQVFRVQIQCSMSEILNDHVDYHPWNFVFLDEKYRCVVSHVKIQLSYFACGGICIVVYFSHKLGDGATLSNFINDWAIIASGLQDIQPPAPVFLGASILPPPNGPITVPTYERSSNVATQRFVFSNSSISKLKKKVILQAQIENPTQVEVVTAFIFERLNLCAGSFKPSSLLQIINFRSIIVPPISNQMVGNIVDRFVVIVTKENEMTFSRIVIELRKSKMEYKDTHKAFLEGKESMNRVFEFWTEDEKKFKEENINDIYAFSSWFRIPFYEANFGFGKPIFVCQSVGKLQRTIFLMANPNGDGIDVFITLERDHMYIFEHDKKLLAFASVNPIICSPN